MIKALLVIVGVERTELMPVTSGKLPSLWLGGSSQLTKKKKLNVLYTEK